MATFSFVYRATHMVFLGGDTSYSPLRNGTWLPLPCAVAERVRQLMASAVQAKRGQWICDWPKRVSWARIGHGFFL